MGAQGTAALDFGAFPGSSHATVDVAAAGVVAASLIEGFIRVVATADHSTDEHMVETLKVFGVYLSDGNLRLHGFNTSEIHEVLAPGAARNGADLGPRRDNVLPGHGGIGTRLYGLFSVAWVWS